MKIYTKVVIDMESSETIYEESYEYEGEVAYCGGSSGGVDNYQSPQQQAVWGQLLPMVSQMGQAATAGQPLWQTGQPPTARDEIPSMQGVMSGVPMYDIPQAAQPTQEWWGGVSKDAKAGLWQPYKEAGQQLTEMMGGRGQAGSARGGFSGAAGAGLGEIAAQGAMNVPMQAWQMGQQGRQDMWGAQLGQNQQGYQNRLQESMADFGRYGTDYQNQMQKWGMEQQAIQAPWNMMPGMLGGTYGENVVDPGSPDQTGQVMGTIAQMMMMYAMGGSDIRLKKNVTKVGTYKGLDVIEFEYLWGNEKNTGLIAQQVQKVKPEAVGKLPNGYLYINYALV